MTFTKKYILIALGLLPVLFWMAVIGYYSVDLPWYDDFDPFPDFLRSWNNAATFSDKLYYLFLPNNEHRMVIGKLVSLAYYGVTGKLSFNFLNYAGACFTLGTAYLFWLSFRKMKLPWFYFIPVLLLLFQLQYHLVYLWAICSLQHQPVVFFLCLSMFFLSKEKLLLAILAAFAANFAMSNGIFVWAAGIVVLILNSNYKHLVVWVLAAGLSVFLYFHGLTTLGNEASILYFKKYPHLSVLGFFAFLGGLFDLLPNRRIEIRTALPILMGFIFMIWIVKWLWFWLVNWWNTNFNRTYFVQDIKRLEPATVFLLGVMSFLLANALVIALLRPRFGFFVMVVSNYKLYPALFLGVTYLAYISHQKSVNWQQIGYKVGMFVSLCIWGFSIYSYLPEVAERSKYLTVNGWNQNHNGFGLGHVPLSEGAEYVDKLMKELVVQKIYSYPESTNAVAKVAQGLTNSLQASNPVTLKVEQDEIMIQEMNGEPYLLKSKDRYAFVKNEDHLYLFKLKQHIYSGRNLLRLYEKGSVVQIQKSILPSGTFKVGYVEMNGETGNGGILGNITIP